MKIKLKQIVGIQRASMRIFEEEDQDIEYVDSRVVRANERAIDRYLSQITDDKAEQSKIYDIITSRNFRTDDDGTYKPICDELRALGYEVEK